MSTVIHATHEAVQKMGGIGTVLEGLVTSPSYQKAIERTFLVGPLHAASDEDRIAREGKVLYSSITGTDGGPVGRKLDRVVEKFNVNLVYGRRRLTDSSTGASAEAEVLLVDSTYLNRRLENNLKLNLFTAFGLESDRYEASADFLLHLRVAGPAYEALAAILTRTKGPHFVLAHEYMGMPLALKAAFEGRPDFRTIFYAHEVATARALVEDSPGHDTMFYNVMSRALESGLDVQAVFGDQSGYYRHALVERSRFCDRIFAVGDRTCDELRFLGLDDEKIDLVYNGIPAVEISARERNASRSLLQEYAESLLGVRPDVVFTHVTRMVTSKGLWRDLRVLEHLDPMFAAEGLTGVFFVLSTVVGTRHPDDVARMEAEYGWPVEHRSGSPDLLGPELDFWADVSSYNLRSTAIQVVFVNQFGWDPASCGSRMPEDMAFVDLRKGTDVEFGQSIYEPFGIAPIEPLTFGALCVVSSACGCLGAVARATDGDQMPNLVEADYISRIGPMELEDLRGIGGGERARLEGERSREVAERILQRLPRSDVERKQALEAGYRVAEKMSWDHVCTDLFLPGLERAARAGGGRRRG